MKQLQKKMQELRKYLQSLGSLAVAYSGGVDSTFLAALATQELGEKCLAITAKSETYPEFEQDEAVKIAKQLGFNHILIETSELNIPNFTDNPPDRCYYCKSELFATLRKIADEKNIQHLADGSNSDDTHDFRPGSKATREQGVLSPLKEYKLNKKEIRELSRQLKLPTAEKPAFACLSSRFPYGEKISAEKIEAVAAAENYLRSAGLKQFRVRHHGNTARIEVLPAEIENLVTKKRTEIVAKFKSLGFTYITLDLEGYRSGSMNEVLSKKEKDCHEH